MRPPIPTRFPRSSHHNSLPAWKSGAQTSFSCHNRRDQYGISVVWARPVTGSSGIPAPGAKKRETKVAVAPRSSGDDGEAIHGGQFCHVGLERANLVFGIVNAQTIRQRSGTASAWPPAPRITSDSRGIRSAGGRENRAHTVHSLDRPPVPRFARGMLRVSASISRRISRITLAVAKVACPHRSTSIVGVNQRRR